MRSADWLVDMGPGAGEHGGHVVASTAGQVQGTKGSVTGEFLSRKREIAIRSAAGTTTARSASSARASTTSRASTSSSRSAVRGRHGRIRPGKSTLVNEIVYKAIGNRLNRMRAKPGAHDGVEGVEVFDKVIDIDQKPIGRTPRSNPDVHGPVHAYPRPLLAHAGGEGARLQARALLVQRQGRPLRDARATARSRSRCTSSRTSTSHARPARARATTVRRSRCASRGRRSRTCWTCPSRRR